MIKKSIFIWLSIIPLAILNGGLRDLVLTPLISRAYSLPLSGITLCLVIFIVSLIFIPRLGRGTERDYIKMGLLWMVLTICFECALGMDRPFSEMIEAYDITTGNLWLLVVLFVGIVPWLIKKIKHL